jgi:hypothetical protein
MVEKATSTVPVAEQVRWQQPLCPRVTSGICRIGQPGRQIRQRVCTFDRTRSAPGALTHCARPPGA